MADLILHHYATSPFSEKVRLILGAKKLPWKSVFIPPIMPKPDVDAHRRLPQDAVPADRRRHVLRQRAHRRRAGAPAARPTLYPEPEKGLVAHPRAVGRHHAVLGRDGLEPAAARARPRCLPRRRPRPPRPSAKTARQDERRQHDAPAPRPMPPAPTSRTCGACRTCWTTPHYLLGEVPSMADFSATTRSGTRASASSRSAPSWSSRPGWSTGWTAWPPSATARPRSFDADEAIAVAKAARRRTRC
jgi:hypothetical protein